MTTYTNDELDCAADALRRYEQSGKNLNLWDTLPTSTKKKWHEKVRVVVEAIDREKSRIKSA